MNERTQIAIKLIASHFILIIGLLLLSLVSIKDDFLLLSITQTVLIILFFAGYWEFFGLRFKNIFCLVIELVILSILIWKVYSGLNSGANMYLVIILSMIQTYLLLELTRILIVINKKNRLNVEIAFPFHQGDYLITDGGNSRISRLMNYHFYSPTHKKKGTSLSMLYATDIVKIGKDKMNFLPITNEAYPIFNEKIYSPIDGLIVKVVNNIPDNKTFAGNYPYNTGNTVVIQKDNLFLLMGHMKQGSIRVKEGDSVKQNDPIGAAGNSGWTERPHLHMQLIQSDSSNYWFGKGVCMLYRDKNLYKNRLIKLSN